MMMMYPNQHPQVPVPMKIRASAGAGGAAGPGSPMPGSPMPLDGPVPERRGARRDRDRQQQHHPRRPGPSDMPPMEFGGPGGDPYMRRKMRAQRNAQAMEEAERAAMVAAGFGRKPERERARRRV
jgi:hypothetical protein